jgi:hypothetical protein
MEVVANFNVVSAQCEDRLWNITNVDIRKGRLLNSSLVLHEKERKI